MDSTLISIPSSTKNREKKRDADAHSVKRTTNGALVIRFMWAWTRTGGLVHTLKGTSANVHDVTIMPELLTGEKETVYGDSGYLGTEK